jgi:hypothetical protein
MKNLDNFINEAIKRGKKNKSTVDLKNFDIILKNLRKDSKDYIGAIVELTDDITIDSVENTDVWGHLDAPVNKVFDRERPQEIELFNKDKVIIIYDKGDDDNDIINLYICKYEDIWYYLNRDDADEFMEYVKILKKDEPK